MTIYKTVSVETTVDVDIGLDEFDDADLIEEIKERGYVIINQKIGLDEFDDADLIEEIEERGYVIINQKDVIEPLDRNDIEILINFIGSQTIGSDLWNIREKLYIINR
jgi:hypothetical protein